MAVGCAWGVRNTCGGRSLPYSWMCYARACVCACACACACARACVCVRARSVHTGHVCLVCYSHTQDYTGRAEASFEHGCSRVQGAGCMQVLASGCKAYYTRLRHSNAVFTGTRNQHLSIPEWMPKKNVSASSHAILKRPGKREKGGQNAFFGCKNAYPNGGREHCVLKHGARRVVLCVARKLGAVNALRVTGVGTHGLRVSFINKMRVELL